MVKGVGNIRKRNNVLVVVGFILILFLFLFSLMLSAFDEEISYYIIAVEDNVWSDELKYVNASLSDKNIYGVDDPNLRDSYEKALDARHDNQNYLQSMIRVSIFIVSLISFMIMFGLFFRRNDGILAQVKGK